MTTNQKDYYSILVYVDINTLLNPQKISERENDKPIATYIGDSIVGESYLVNTVKNQKLTILL